MPFIPLPVAEIMNTVILAATMECATLPPPQIRVEAVRKPTSIDHTLSREQLRAFETDTAMPREMRSLSHVDVGGIMKAAITTRYDIDFAHSGILMKGHCVHIKKIHVILELAPAIYIAAEHPEGSCFYEKIREHEESHIDMDKVVVEKYADRIKDGLKLAFAVPDDGTAGPVSKRRIKKLESNVGANVMQMVNVMLKDMARERAEKQAGVDSAQGYNYITTTCNPDAKVVKVQPGP